MNATSSKIMTGLAAALALGVVAVPATGDAQSNGRMSNQPIAYGADQGEQTPETISLRGRAEITQGGNRLRADNITMYRNASGDPERVEATGTVYFVTPTQSMRGERAVYSIARGQVVVSGNVVLTQGQNVLTGGQLTYDVDRGTANMAGAPRGAAGNRIQGVFYPGSN